jgi:hypothetical protein
MRRRELIALLGGAAATWPLSAHSQTPVRLGYLSAGTATSFYMRRTLAGLTQGFTENGMIEGRDYLLETRYAEGDYERFPALARELQQAKVRIILPSTIAAVRAAQQLSPPIPVVMPAINDPVGTGLIASLAHPGGLTTGTATLNQDVTPKLLEFLQVVVPRAATLATLYNPANPSNLNFLPVLRSQCDARGILDRARFQVVRGLAQHSSGAHGVAAPRCAAAGCRFFPPRSGRSHRRTRAGPTPTHVRVSSGHRLCRCSFGLRPFGNRASSPVGLLR